MLRFYKFRDDLPAPVPAKDVYEKRGGGRGWPEECPPLRAANGFGWDIVAPFEMRFRRQSDGGWTIENPQELESDWLWGGDEESEGVPLTQVNAWFWDENQEIPHKISPEVYRQIRNQVKVSTYLFLSTDPGELIYMTSIPNRERPYRAFTALLETDWYPASYPWHCVIELDPMRDEIVIEQGEPICRLFLVRREHYFAQEMSTEEFERFFQRGQLWLERNGHGMRDGMVDITRTYVREQRRSTFSVIL
ncbi:MAG TPA: DUF6065 family protein [Planctomycetota bacterium]|nr:DUF6065 family protein [Planctomycetota bacterium]